MSGFALTPKFSKWVLAAEMLTYVPPSERNSKIVKCHCSLGCWGQSGSFPAVVGRFSLLSSGKLSKAIKVACDFVTGVPGGWRLPTAGSGVTFCLSDRQRKLSRREKGLMGHYKGYLSSLQRLLQTNSGRRDQRSFLQTSAVWVTALWMVIMAGTLLVYLSSR